MAGIISFGAHIPVTRLSRAVIGQSWESRGPQGERAVANYDEDSLTMAVAAARNCLKHFPNQKVDALYFASTTAPYLEKQSAAFSAAVLSLDESTQTIDFGNTLRAGTDALAAAVNAVNAGAVETVLVVATDMRIFLPKSAQEMANGDGAVALLIGKQNVVAEIEWIDSYCDEIQDVWLLRGEKFLRNAEDRFVQDMGYARVIRNAVSKSMKKHGVNGADYAKFCANFADPKVYGRMVGKFGFNPETAVDPALNMNVGDTGCAMALMNLVMGLEAAKAGDKFLVANYGNGANVVSVKATEKLASHPFARKIADQIAVKIPVSSYNKYMIWRGLVEVAQIPRPPLNERQPTPSAQWREVKWELTLAGTKCQECGTVQYPPQRVCMKCKAKDKMDRACLNRTPAKVVTFSNDYIMETLDAPVTTTVVDFEGGGRMICDMTDRKLDELVVGMDLDFTFRKLYSVGGINNYWWKCTPVRK